MTVNLTLKRCRIDVESMLKLLIRRINIDLTSHFSLRISNRDYHFRLSLLILMIQSFLVFTRRVFTFVGQCRR